MLSVFDENSILSQKQLVDSEKLSPIPAVSAVVAVDWLRLDGGMET